MRIGEKPEIARLPLFRDMAEKQRDLVLAGSYLQVFPPQLTLFEAGQDADFLHVLVDGLVELFVQGARHHDEYCRASLELHSRRCGDGYAVSDVRANACVFANSTGPGRAIARSNPAG